MRYNSWVVERRRRWRHVVIVLVGLFAATPLVAAAVASLQPPGEGTLSGLGWLWRTPSLDAFRVVLRSSSIGRWMLSSALVCLFAVPVATVTASLAGTAAVCARGRGRALVIGASVLALLVPPMALWTPRVVAATRLGLADEPLVLAAPALAATTPVAVLLCALATARIPASLLDAAVVEGHGPLELWWKVIVPLTRRTLMAVAVLVMISHWGDVVEPLLLLGHQDQLTVAVGIAQFRTTEVPQYPVMLAASVLAAAPPLVIFLLGQHRLLGGDE